MKCQHSTTNFCYMSDVLNKRRCFFIYILILKGDKDMGVMNVRKPYFDNDMVHCFWVEDIKLIVLNPRSDQIK